ncbi:unnamed protein product [Vicia faba]|uniref:Uncharacterized protein n=1 Tax=Vicia faba TaxID=3906 RepID=A0AAV1ADG0_VICFA|nr:unnamed protein product [Vicia faba]
MPKTPESSPITTSLQTSNATRPLQVYTRRAAPIIQPVQVPESDPILETVINETVLEEQIVPPETEVDGTDLEEQNISMDARDLPIAIRKDVRASIRCQECFPTWQP